MSVWKPIERRKTAQLWSRPGEIGDRFLVTADGAESAELPGREQGYPDADTAWLAFDQRKAIARELDLNQ